MLFALFYSGVAAGTPARPYDRKLDEYGNIRWGDEKARLDNFAIEMQLEPSAKGYIFCYGGRRGRAGEALRRCNRAKGYVSGYRHVEAGRIMTLNAGFREELTVELWVLPPGVTPPTASPTVDPAEVKLTKAKPHRSRPKR